jgi:hypothetical protein
LLGDPWSSRGLDGLWGHLKRNTLGVNARHEAAVDRRVRESQWWHWCGFEDRWAAAGEVIAFKP